MEMNIPQKIKSRCPNITAIIDENIKFWSKVELVYLKRIEYIKNAAEEKNFISLRKSLIDDMILFRNERIKLDAFLRDIDLKAKTIYDSIHDDKQKIDKLKVIFKQLILPVIKESKSYDRVAEVYAIDYLISRRHLKVIQFEYPLGNRKHADCLIQDIENGECVLLDFVSINVDSERVESTEKFGIYLAEKIKKKYVLKTTNLKALSYPFRLLPILWLEDKILKEYFVFLVESETNLNTEFFLLRGIENITENKFHTLFGPVSDYKYLT